MIDISEIGVADILARLPEPVPWDIGLLQTERIDLLICAAGFEERAAAIVSDVVGLSIGSLILVNYPTNVTENIAGLEALRQIECREDKSEIEYDRQLFRTRLNDVLRNREQRHQARVVVDVSGMASYLVYRVLNSVWECCPTARLAVYYAEARDYSPSRDEWRVFYDSVEDRTDNLAVAERYEERYFQARGIDETYESDVFPGRNIGPLATEVIAIPSFSLQRMKAMLAFLEARYNASPSTVRWFLGQPPDKVRNGWRYDALARLYNVQSGGVAVSTREFSDVLRKLDELWADIHTDRHIVIATLGSKMQHLGTFLFLRMHSECGLVVCEPEEFIARQYSAGLGPKWWLDFGLIADVQRLLDSRGQVRFQW